MHATILILGLLHYAAYISTKRPLLIGENALGGLAIQEKKGELSWKFSLVSSELLYYRC